MKTDPELPAHGRGVGSLCIIDEALYRQTALNAEMLAAPPPRPAAGGWGCGEEEAKSGALLC